MHDNNFFPPITDNFLLLITDTDIDNIFNSLYTHLREQLKYNKSNKNVDFSKREIFTCQIFICN